VIGREIITLTGHPFSLVFEDLSSGGYVWTCTDVPGTIQSLATTRGERLDRPDEVTFVFLALSAGEFVLTFELGRPWESVPADELEVRVKVIDN
jgi:hypothetical protein